MSLKAFMPPQEFSFFCKEELDEEIYLNIQQHLQLLFNARQGSLLHLPDYGLPDLSEVYQSLPYSINNLIYSVANTIEKYEPRVTKVSVRPRQSDRDSCIIQLEIHANLQQGPKIKFDSYFFSGNKAIVEAREAFKS